MLEGKSWPFLLDVGSLMDLSQVVIVHNLSKYRVDNAFLLEVF